MAGEIKVGLCIMNLKSIDEYGLMNSLEKAPKKSIIVIEDVNSI